MPEINQSVVMNLVFIASIVLMFVVMTMSQKKKSKKEQELRDSIKIGDEIITIGGIIGKVISVREETFVIESQSEKLRIAKWSVATVNKGNKS